MQARGAALPEFPMIWNQTVSTPVVWARRVLTQLGLLVLISSLEHISRRQDLTLR